MFRRDFFRGLFGGAAAIELPEVKSVEMMRLQPGDAIMIKLAGCASYDQLQRIKNFVQARFPNNIVLVMEGGIDISIIKQ